MGHSQIKQNLTRYVLLTPPHQKAPWLYTIRVGHAQNNIEQLAPAPQFNQLPTLPTQHSAPIKPTRTPTQPEDLPVAAPPAIPTASEEFIRYRNGMKSLTTSIYSSRACLGAVGGRAHADGAADCAAEVARLGNADHGGDL